MTTTHDHFSILLDMFCKYGHIKLVVNVFNKNKNDTRVSLHPDERFERTIRNTEKVFDEIRSSGIEPDVTRFFIVLHVYSHAPKLQLCLDKLSLMKEKAICPNMVTYTSIIKCLCSCKRLKDGEALLDEMLDQVGIVKEIWNDMKETGTRPDLDLYTILIHELCERQSKRDACHYFAEMVANGFLPQKVTFEMLYKGLIHLSRLHVARDEDRYENKDMHEDEEEICHILPNFRLKLVSGCLVVSCFGNVIHYLLYVFVLQSEDLMKSGKGWS
ncbi:hypothetical protein RJT34_03811 [Clitoria ternatea]|uniref:Pentatricopeptide repeat-containing protein n=1 Tax=Clitoria ternatea TaxID=43366 RepID=A0AAN9Q5G0_CLITE